MKTKCFGNSKYEYNRDYQKKRDKYILLLFNLDDELVGSRFTERVRGKESTIIRRLEVEGWRLEVLDVLSSARDE